MAIAVGSDYPLLTYLHLFGVSLVRTIAFSSGYLYNVNREDRNVSRRVRSSSRHSFTARARHLQSASYGVICTKDVGTNISEGRSLIFSAPM